MDKAFVQKLVWSVLGIGVYVLSTWKQVEGIAELLKMAAGGMLTSPWVARPGDGALIAAGKEAVRKSMAPAAFTACALLFMGCATAPTPREALEGAKRAQESLDRMCEELERTRPLREEVTDGLDTAIDREAVGPADAPAAESAEGPAQPEAPAAAPAP